MKRVLGVSGLAGVALILTVSASLLAGSFLPKESLPTFPPSADDGLPLPPPPGAISTGPAVPTPPAIKPPADLLVLPAPEAPVDQSQAGLAAYVAARSAALAQLPAEATIAARITFKSGLAPQTAVQLLAGARVTVLEYEWALPKAFDHGGFPAWELPDILGAHPDLVIVEARGWAEVADLRSITATGQAWLIDPVGNVDLFWSAQSAGLVTR